MAAYKKEGFARAQIRAVTTSSAFEAKGDSKRISPSDMIWLRVSLELSSGCLFVRSASQPKLTANNSEGIVLRIIVVTGCAALGDCDTSTSGVHSICARDRRNEKNILHVVGDSRISVSSLDFPWRVSSTDSVSMNRSRRKSSILSAADASLCSGEGAVCGMDFTANAGSGKMMCTCTEERFKALARTVWGEQQRGVRLSFESLDAMDEWRYALEWVRSVQCVPSLGDGLSRGTFGRRQEQVGSSPATLQAEAKRATRDTSSEGMRSPDTVQSNSNPLTSIQEGKLTFPAHYAASVSTHASRTVLCIEPRVGWEILTSATMSTTVEGTYSCWTCSEGCNQSLRMSVSWMVRRNSAPQLPCLPATEVTGAHAVRVPHTRPRPKSTAPLESDGKRVPLTTAAVRAVFSDEEEKADTSLSSFPPLLDGNEKVLAEEVQASGAQRASISTPQMSTRSVADTFDNALEALAEGSEVDTVHDSLFSGGLDHSEISSVDSDDLVTAATEKLVMQMGENAEHSASELLPLLEAGRFVGTQHGQQHQHQHQHQQHERLQSSSPTQEAQELRAGTQMLPLLNSNSSTSSPKRTRAGERGLSAADTVVQQPFYLRCCSAPPEISSPINSIDDLYLSSPLSPHVDDLLEQRAHYIRIEWRYTSTSEEDAKDGYTGTRYVARPRAILAKEKQDATKFLFISAQPEQGDPSVGTSFALVLAQYPSWRICVNAEASDRGTLNTAFLQVDKYVPDPPPTLCAVLDAELCDVNVSAATHAAVPTSYSIADALLHERRQIDGQTADCAVASKCTAWRPSQRVSAEDGSDMVMFTAAVQDSTRSVSLFGTLAYNRRHRELVLLQDDADADRGHLDRTQAPNDVCLLRAELSLEGNGGDATGGAGSPIGEGNGRHPSRSGHTRMSPIYGSHYSPKFPSYAPSNLLSHDTASSPRFAQAAAATSASIPLLEQRVSAAQEPLNFVFIGSTGAGKSTLLRWLWERCQGFDEETITLFERIDWVAERERYQRSSRSRTESFGASVAAGHGRSRMTSTFGASPFSNLQMIQETLAVRDEGSVVRLGQLRQHVRDVDLEFLLSNAGAIGANETLLTVMAEGVPVQVKVTDVPGNSDKELIRTCCSSADAVLCIVNAADMFSLSWLEERLPFIFSQPTGTGSPVFPLDASVRDPVRRRLTGATQQFVLCCVNTNTSNQVVSSRELEAFMSKAVWHCSGRKGSDIATSTINVCQMAAAAHDSTHDEIVSEAKAVSLAAAAQESITTKEFSPSTSTSTLADAASLLPEVVTALSAPVPTWHTWTIPSTVAGEVSSAQCSKLLMKDFLRLITEFHFARVASSVAGWSGSETTAFLSSFVAPMVATGSRSISPPHNSESRPLDRCQQVSDVLQKVAGFSSLVARETSSEIVNCSCPVPLLPKELFDVACAVVERSSLAEKLDVCSPRGRALPSSLSSSTEVQKEGGSYRGGVTHNKAWVRGLDLHAASPQHVEAANAVQSGRGRSGSLNDEIAMTAASSSMMRGTLQQLTSDLLLEGAAKRRGVPAEDMNTNSAPKLRRRGTAVFSSERFSASNAHPGTPPFFQADDALTLSVHTSEADSVFLSRPVSAMAEVAPHGDVDPSLADMDSAENSLLSLPSGGSLGAVDGDAEVSPAPTQVAASAAVTATSIGDIRYKEMVTPRFTLTHECDLSIRWKFVRWLIVGLQLGQLRQVYCFEVILFLCSVSSREEAVRSSSPHSRHPRLLERYSPPHLHHHNRRYDREKGKRVESRRQEALSFQQVCEKIMREPLPESSTVHLPSILVDLVAVATELRLEDVDIDESVPQLVPRLQLEQQHVWLPSLVKMWQRIFASGHVFLSTGDILRVLLTASGLSFAAWEIFRVALTNQSIRSKRVSLMSTWLGKLLDGTLSWLDESCPPPADLQDAMKTLGAPLCTSTTTLLTLLRLWLLRVRRNPRFLLALHISFSGVIERQLNAAQMSVVNAGRHGGRGTSISTHNDFRVAVHGGNAVCDGDDNDDDDNAETSTVTHRRTASFYSASVAQTDDTAAGSPTFSQTGTIEFMGTEHFQNSSNMYPANSRSDSNRDVLKAAQRRYSYHSGPDGQRCTPRERRVRSFDAFAGAMQSPGGKEGVNGSSSPPPPPDFAFSYSNGTLLPETSILTRELTEELQREPRESSVSSGILALLGPSFPLDWLPRRFLEPVTAQPESSFSPNALLLSESANGGAATEATDPLQPHTYANMSEGVAGAFGMLGEMAAYGEGEAADLVGWRAGWSREKETALLRKMHDFVVSYDRERDEIAAEPFGEEALLRYAGPQWAYRVQQQGYTDTDALMEDKLTDAIIEEFGPLLYQD